MSEKLSRRDFMKIAIMAGIGIPVVYGVGKAIDNSVSDPTFKIDLDKKEGFGFEEAIEFATRIDNCLDQIPSIEPDATSEGLYRYAAEIIPQFEYEGIVPQSYFPKEVKFAYFGDGMEANHILGRSDCQSFAVVNSRVANPVSSWYESDDLVFTLTHELAHVAQQEMCYTEDRSFIENSAQIAAMEVCSGLALSGNKEFFRAALDELRGMTMGTAMAVAIKEKRMDEYRNFREKRSPGAIPKARFERSQRFWEDSPNELGEILSRYNQAPMDMMLKAIKGNDEIKLAFPPIYENERPYPAAEPRPIKLDDTHYLIKNMEALTMDFNK